MPETTHAIEGYIPFHGYRTWYRVAGEDTGTHAPILILHGGPGAPHDYLENLEALTDAGRRVVFYDQLGCGNSDQTHQPEMYTVGLFVEELGEVRRALGLDRCHILGQSWGGMLAMEYALTQPTGVLSLVIADSPASMSLWVAEANRLRAELPPEVQATLLKHEAAGTTDDPDYQQAMLAFYQRHVCRLNPYPEFVQRAFERISPEVYGTMNGPSEFHVIGTLKHWDITSRLGEISLPALLISGRYDEATPLIVEQVHRGIPGSEWVLFEHSSHMPHVEEAERFRAVVNEFLDRVESRT
ncbi:MAG TPA: proline iminopeptidase-family hydrolase [Ktedonobacterales bacterium]|nr:proline iminopeptidase-family hydrolase [Ktedonobacterales bacterium]